MEGNPASSYVSHGINLTVMLLALRAAAVYNQTLETLSSLIFLKTSPEDRGPRRGGTKGRPVAPLAAARSTGGFGGSPTKSSIRAGNRHGTGRASGQFPSPAERAVTDLPVRLLLFQLWGPGVASREVKGLLRPRLPKTRATKSELPFPGHRHWARSAPPKGERGPRRGQGRWQGRLRQRTAFPPEGVPTTLLRCVPTPRGLELTVCGDETSREATSLQ